ncbi:hypothetical protein ACS2TZ_26120 [Bacillus cereus group sp. Bce025]|uniref:hypothetical protein n=1 Tax=Bacillus cereus TaxID=1396 RepID=UPI000B4BF475|nr:hypothetical protein [Bacillus cereus]MDA2478322.1 hypothetical protein [Bacillus cereus]MDA2495483.1 hypothetical protein [Bacillus cereus]
MAEFEAVRVEADNTSAIGNNLEFFVITGSMEAPIVCLADNNGYPHVRDIYARQREHSGHHGVHVSVRFEGPAQGNALAVNIAQPGMTGDYTVIPRA